MNREEKSARRKLIRRLKKQRYTYREIGEKLQLTKQRVQQIFKETDEILQPKELQR
jgi:DNA-directed RNA polymerase sigma subunit (sigma70/sigma32)